MTAVKAALEALLSGASIDTINAPFQLWLLQRNVKCCKYFERFWRKSIKLQTLQESFSSNLMQRPGGLNSADDFLNNNLELLVEVDRFCDLGLGHGNKP